MSPKETLLFILCMGVLVAVCLGASLSYGAPPVGADPALAPWFKNLRESGTGIDCCGEGDCRPVRTRIHNGKLEAFIDSETFRDAPNDWVLVPEEVMIRGTENPVGEPIACWWGFKIHCFHDASGS